MANSLNRAMLIGNLTRDPELRKTANGQSVTSFSIATNRAFTTQTGERKEQADYHNIVAWGRLAEICAQYLTKGKKVYVDGRIQNREWEGQDGQKRYRTEIVAENMIMLDKAGAGMGGGTPFKSEAPASDDAPTPVADDEIKLEDIPF
ncbi:single-stranded DNA-binding protein [Candidatus Uhrbacteria bacterium]|nr:single-stranded DNA-binding protein [Candidatus Uhrbacteria bacterium]